MLAVIIADSSFAMRERAMLSRLEVGLADEGVRVIHAVPAPLADTQNTPSVGLQSTIVGYSESHFPIGRRARAADLLRAIESTSDEPHPPNPITIVHAFGADSWPIALDLAHLAGATALLELWHPGLIPDALKALANSKQSPPEFIVSEPPIAAALSARAPRAKIYSAPWGVHAPPTLPARDFTARPLAAAILSDTGDPRPFNAALTGLIRAIPSPDDLLIFASVAERGAGFPAGVSVSSGFATGNSSFSREQPLWQAARRHDLLDRFTVSPDMESRREPVLEMDLLLLPEATGRQRTLILEAMAAGVPIIAAPDPFSETLARASPLGIAAATLPVSGPGSGSPRASAPIPHTAWTEAIRTTILNPQAATDLTRAAHEYVRSRRTASTHVADVLRAYQQAARVPAAAE